jgi:L-fucose mutarotase
MLKYSLIHPELIAALAGAGHGSKVLIADGNYPHSTGVNPRSTVVHLNLTPGTLTVTQVLSVLLDAINVESAEVMACPEGEVPAHREYKEILGVSVPVTTRERFEFYDQARNPDVALVIATADQRMCANLLLTIGTREN